MVMDSGNRNAPRYRIDDQVFFSPASGLARMQAPAECYTVVAVLPPDGTGSRQYRLRPLGAGPERIAVEFELRR